VDIRSAWPSIAVAPCDIAGASISAARKNKRTRAGIKITPHDGERIAVRDFSRSPRLLQAFLRLQLPRGANQFVDSLNTFVWEINMMHYLVVVSRLKGTVFSIDGKDEIEQDFRRI
jgi:hypothetical protein